MRTISVGGKPRPISPLTIRDQDDMDLGISPERAAQVVKGLSREGRRRLLGDAMGRILAGSKAPNRPADQLAHKICVGWLRSLRASLARADPTIDDEAFELMVRQMSPEELFLGAWAVAEVCNESFDAGAPKSRKAQNFWDVYHAVWGTGTPADPYSLN